MKKWLVFLFAMSLIFSLCSCTSSDSADISYTTSVNGINLTVNPEEGTISDGTNLYRYTVSAYANGYKVNITYPDGSSWWWNEQRSGEFSSGSGGWSDDYDETSYIEGSVLQKAVISRIPEPQEPKNILLIVVLIAVGIFNLFFPQTSWYLGYGWRYSNAEPSEAALVLNRIGGGVAVAVALLLLLF